LIAFTAAGFLSRQYRMDQAINQGALIAKNAAILGQTVVAQLDSEEMMEKDPDVREEIHDIFRVMCKELGITYLYIFSVDEQGLRHRIISAAADDEKDRIINEEMGFGTISKEPLKPMEKLALGGLETGGLGVFDNSFGYVLTWTLPLISDDGEVAALLSADYSMSEIMKLMHDNFMLMLMTTSVIFGAMFGLILLFTWQFVLRPVRALSDRMQHFVEDQDKDLQPFQPSRITEVGRIEESFQDMAGDISRYLNDIRSLTAEKVQSEVEINIAKRIQSGMVPPLLEHSTPMLSVCAMMQPAKEVGGDFYDIIDMPDGKIGLIIGDVSGKGIGAALFMAMTRRIIRDRLLAFRDPAESLNLANEVICRENPEGMFATSFAAVWDPDARRLTYANAGHTQPVVINSDGASLLEVDPGIVVGLFDDAGIQNGELYPEENSGLFLYTDGVTEAMNTEGELFGTNRLMEALANKDKQQDTRSSVEEVSRQVLAYEQEAGQFDDLTILFMHFTSAPEKSENRRLELKVDQTAIAEIREAIRKALPSGDPLEKKEKKILVAAEEMFANIVMYSGASFAAAEISRADGTLTVCLEDDGIPFDPTNRDTGEKEFDELDSGGMGIMLAKQICQEMSYQRTGDRNRLRMVFE
ncbi:MAG: SpoIIE family protein phosphatase, partial [Butyrivibrio sp.]|nr:SpoIIE family protein phosphatase [Butyrivibrio sp.]